MSNTSKTKLYVVYFDNCRKDKPSAKKKLSELVDEAEELETEADVSKVCDRCIV